MSFAARSIGNALSVVVRTLPRLPNAGRSVNAISSSGASTMESLILGWATKGLVVCGYLFSAV